MTRKEKIEALVKELAVDLVPAVSKIEASVATTQNHYGDYLSILSVPKSQTERKLVALALLEAGANRNGIVSAMHLF